MIFAQPIEDFALTSSRLARSRRRGIALAGIFLCGTMFAQEAAPPEGTPATRGLTVGGHVFSPTSLMADPFVRTYVRNSLGFGLTPELKLPPVKIGEMTYTWNSGQLLFALLQFEFQDALREWLAVEVQVNVTGRLANSTIPLISQGVVLNTGFELGALFEVYRSTDVLLSLSAGALNTSVTDIDIMRFVNALIDTGQITPENSLFTSTPTVRAFADARLAYGINDLLGIMAQARILYGESTERSDSDQWFSLVALFLDINPSQRWGFPVGFGVGVKAHTEPGRVTQGTRSLQTLFGRISYSGAKDFDFALDVSHTWIPLSNTLERTTYLSAIIDVRLLF